jgi:hypothetical protein
MSNIPRIYSSQAAQIRGMPTGGGGGGKAVPGDAAASIQRAASAVPAKAEKQHLGYHWRHFIAGGMGGMVGATMTCPLEVVKTVLQSKEQKNKSVVRVVGGILRYEGLPGFFKGIGPMVLGVVPARATYFATYDGTKVRSPPHSPFLLLLSLALPLFLLSIRLTLSCAVKSWSGSSIDANRPRRNQHPQCGGLLHPQPRTGCIATGNAACSPRSACARHTRLFQLPPWPSLASLASHYLLIPPIPFLFSVPPPLSVLSIHSSLDRPSLDARPID